MSSRRWKVVITEVDERPRSSSTKVEGERGVDLGTKIEAVVDEGRGRVFEIGAQRERKGHERRLKVLRTNDGTGTVARVVVT
jgi:hypothetical protein